MGTSRHQTAGHRHNIVNWSVLQSNTLGASQKIVQAIRTVVPGVVQVINNSWQSSTIESVMNNGLTIAHADVHGLKHIANELRVEPFSEGAPKLLTPHVATTIAGRIMRETDRLEMETNRLHAKVEISDASKKQMLQYAQSWRQVAGRFEQTAAILEAHKIAVELNK